MTCPTPGKAAHEDLAAAEDALAAHVDGLPGCPGVHAYMCGEGHYHVGHETRQASAECRRRPNRARLEALVERFAR